MWLDCLLSRCCVQTSTKLVNENIGKFRDDKKCFIKKINIKNVFLVYSDCERIST